MRERALDARLVGGDVIVRRNGDTTGDKVVTADQLLGDTLVLRNTLETERSTSGRVAANSPSSSSTLDRLMSGAATPG